MFSACTENKLLDVKVKCKGNDQCNLYNGQEKLVIDIIITNKHNSAIGFPLEFFGSTGPGIKLIDTRTKKETYVPTSLANFEVENMVTIIQPGKSLTIDQTINSDELKQFDGPDVDVSAEIIVVAKILVDGKHVDFEGSDTIRIVSKDKP
jgi:hypothetical protein